jgi:hypothetical protein
MPAPSSTDPYFIRFKELLRDFTELPEAKVNIMACKFTVFITYSISEPATSVSRPLFLGTTNTCYESLILLLVNKELAYVMLRSNIEDTSVSFLHVRALCPVLLQFL